MRSLKKSEVERIRSILYAVLDKESASSLLNQPRTILFLSNMCFRDCELITNISFISNSKVK